MAGRLQDKVAVITGAASGIGRATVDLFVAEGARVIAADIQEDKGARIEEDHRNAQGGGRAKFVRCDVMQEADIAAAVAAATSEFGGLDVLFNNAGIGGVREPADKVTAEGFDSVMHLHVRAAMFGMKYAVPAMRKRGGSIISTASVAGLQSGFGPMLYSVAKAAVIHMTRTAAAQLGHRNIRVNCICPGMIATNVFAASFDIPSQLAESRIEALEEAGKSFQPIPRGGRGRDIAEAALYLASDGSSFVTGQALVVDGGIALGANDATRLSIFENIFSALGVPQDEIAKIFGPKKR